jgi:hypothetical protein
MTNYDDLIRRLRAMCHCHPENPCMADEACELDGEAADAIEALVAERDKARAKHLGAERVCDQIDNMRVKAEAEIPLRCTLCLTLPGCNNSCGRMTTNLETAARAALAAPGDGRPYSADEFIRRLDDYTERDGFNVIDLRERVSAWNHGAWDEATEGLTDAE